MSNMIALNPHLREIRKAINKISNFLFGNIKIKKLNLLLCNHEKYSDFFSKTKIVFEIETMDGKKSEFTFVDMDESCNVKMEFIKGLGPDPTIEYSILLYNKNVEKLDELLEFVKDYIPDQEYTNIKTKNKKC